MKAKFKGEGEGLESSNMDELLALEGLVHIKDAAIQVAASNHAERHLSAKQRVPTGFHLALMGNPGIYKNFIYQRW